MASFLSDADALAFAEEHLQYELRMLTDAAQFPAWNLSWFSWNANIEAYALHLRNWEDFFYPPQRPKPDDVTWRDYVVGAPPAWEPPPPSKDLQAAGQMASKQIVHITTARYPDGDLRKAWSASLVLEVQALFRQFAQHAAPGRLSPNARAAFLSAIGPLPAGASVASPPATST